MYGYSPVGDLTVISICFVMIVLICFSFVQKNRSFKIFLAILGTVILAAASDVVFYVVTEAGNEAAALVIRCVYHSMLFLLFFFFAFYICEVARFEQNLKKIFTTIASILLVLSVAADIITVITGVGRDLPSDGILSLGRNIFIDSYLAFLILVVVMIVMARKRLYVKIMRGFYGAVLLSIIMLVIQVIVKDSSYTVVSFMYPILAIFYTLHSNPFNATLGAVDLKAFTVFVDENYRAGNEFFFFSLFLKPYANEGIAIPDDIQERIRVHGSTNFRSATLFNVEKGHIIMAAKKKHNKDYKQRMKVALKEFQEEYEQFGVDYKVVIGESIPAVSEKNGYVSLIRNIREQMDENSIHVVNEEDVKIFDLHEYIRNSLDDIFHTHDLDDPRVLTYCQPVYNINTRKYDTAEALMRLKLDNTIYYPDQFIPVAENNGYIHMLTEIILHKTCMELRRLLEEGYEISRISINVSALELKEDHFCEDIRRIIRESDIPGHKIAIELTESQTDSDFLVMKQKINELKEQGIQFYLDDFGTGYSNMERIMELPFDIIKFDRALVIACEENDRSKKIVLGLANIFTSMNYSVLYEGVEEEKEEEMCINMSASYLQGYKYSRPIPIQELRSYMERVEA